ncbi:hypothetical protein [Acidovorax sp.]|uniref:hypothetical protein n=1 Tax=Acidovorax sp. TaxID=1872122 RepID=UPI0026181A11|nr:hypothetical protein [Acidovorax sp.]
MDEAWFSPSHRLIAKPSAATPKPAAQCLLWPRGGFSAEEEFSEVRRTPLHCPSGVGQTMERKAQSHARPHGRTNTFRYGPLLKKNSTMADTCLDTLALACTPPEPSERDKWRSPPWINCQIRPYRFIRKRK